MKQEEEGRVGRGTFGSTLSHSIPPERSLGFLLHLQSIGLKNGNKIHLKGAHSRKEMLERFCSRSGRETTRTDDFTLVRIS